MVENIRDSLAAMRERHDMSKGTRGSVKNQDRLAAFGGPPKSGGAEWGTCKCELLHAVIDEITKKGGAVTLGLSRDGGAHMLTLLLDENRKTLWFNGDSDLDEELAAVLARLEEMP